MSKKLCYIFGNVFSDAVDLFAGKYFTVGLAVLVTLWSEGKSFTAQERRDLLAQVYCQGDKAFAQGRAPTYVQDMMEEGDHHAEIDPAWKATFCREVPAGFFDAHPRLIFLQVANVRAQGRAQIQVQSFAIPHPFSLPPERQLSVVGDTESVERPRVAVIQSSEEQADEGVFSTQSVLRNQNTSAPQSEVSRMLAEELPPVEPPTPGPQQTPDTSARAAHQDFLTPPPTPAPPTPAPTALPTPGAQSSDHMFCAEGECTEDTESAENEEDSETAEKEDGVISTPPPLPSQSILYATQGVAVQPKQNEEESCTLTQKPRRTQAIFSADILENLERLKPVSPRKEVKQTNQPSGIWNEVSEKILFYKKDGTSDSEDDTSDIEWSSEPDDEENNAPNGLASAEKSERSVEPDDEENNAPNGLASAEKPKAPEPSQNACANDVTDTDTSREAEKPKAPEPSQNACANTQKGVARTYAAGERASDQAGLILALVIKQRRLAFSPADTPVNTPLSSSRTAGRSPSTSESKRTGQRSKLEDKGSRTVSMSGGSSTGGRGTSRGLSVKSEEIQEAWAQKRNDTPQRELFVRQEGEGVRETSALATPLLKATETNQAKEPTTLENDQVIITSTAT